MRLAPTIRPGTRSEQGLSLVEVLLALAISAVLIAALGGVVGPTLTAWELAQRDNQLTREARFAVDRMTAAVRGTSLLVLPRADDPNTAYSESVRPVLAVALDPTWDRDRDGFADADNDKDGRIDEDWGRDNNNDGQAGISGIDDDGDGRISGDELVDFFKDRDDGDLVWTLGRTRGGAAGGAGRPGRQVSTRPMSGAPAR